MSTPKTIFADWHVVVTDDDPDSLTISQMMLERQGMVVIKALNGAECLAQMRLHQPRFVICDLSMPVMSGWDVIEEVRRDPLLSQIPLIAFSAHAMPEDRERALAAGFRYYLTKPLNPRTFIEDLKKALAIG